MMQNQSEVLHNKNKDFSKILVIWYSYINSMSSDEHWSETVNTLTQIRYEEVSWDWTAYDY